MTEDYSIMTQKRRPKENFDGYTRINTLIEIQREENKKFNNALESYKKQEKAKNFYQSNKIK